MAKAHKQYVCNECGSISSRWEGKCNDCGAWNSLSEEKLETSAPKGLKPGKGQVLEFTALQDEIAAPQRISSAITELDRTLGGGIVPGSAILIGGDPGIGKSTLLLQLAAHLARSGEEVAYITGEESVAQVQMRATRLELADSPVRITAGNSVRDILTSLSGANAPTLAVIDSIQTMYVDSIDAAPGTVSQVRAASHELIRMAKSRNIALVLVGHVTKDGQIAGPRVLEHMVDCVLYFEGERGLPFRLLRTVKNRFGGTDEIGVFEMTGLGLQEVKNPSALFLSERDTPVSGSAVLAGIEGTRPVLLEMQALVAPSSMATPRRAVVGWDSARLAMLLAVLETRAGIRLSDREVYLNVSGGLRIQEPAADLTAAAAILSAAMDIPLPTGSVFFGEIALSGEIRPATRLDLRLKEAEKLGFETVYTAQPNKQKGKSQVSLGIKPLNHVQDLLNLVKSFAA